MLTASSLTRPLWRWFDRRSPRAREVRLGHKSIFVLPTKSGAGFLLVLVLLWLLGTNYENNLILALVFLLLAVMLVSALHAFKNLSGLRISVARVHPAFVGGQARFELLAQAAPNSSHENLRLGWSGAASAPLDLVDQTRTRVTVRHPATERGWLQPDRLRVESHFPLGLIRAWSWVRLDVRTLVYPEPRQGGVIDSGQVAAEQGNRINRQQQEEFHGFRAWQPGASLAHVAWKLYARGADLVLKDYVGYESESLWLDWDSLPGRDSETRLSQLCHWALTYGEQSVTYGLRLPGLTLMPGRGERHQAGVLKALALYGKPGYEASRCE